MVVMPPPLKLGLCDSDDDDSLPPLPSNASKASPDAAKKMQESFMLSKSGTFKVTDFQVNKGGLVAASERDAPRPNGAGPSSRSPTAAALLDVASMDELETLDELGSGASGTVFRARHTPTGTIVAVKQVRISEKAKRDQVVAELRIMRKHLSPWLVALYNAFYHEATVYTVLEYCDNGSLADLVNSKPEGLRDELVLGRIAGQLVNGLHYLHKEHHQVHRDLKPANVLLTAAGAVKVTDFGISTQLDNTAGMCSTFIGTTCYMSPERLTGDAYSYTSDVWSLGLILLELATGRFPFPAADSFFKLVSQLADAPSPSVPEGFSDAFAEFISLCLEKDPARRPPAKDLLKHPWLREFPLMMDDALLADLLGAISIE